MEKKLGWDAETRRRKRQGKVLSNYKVIFEKKNWTLLFNWKMRFTGSLFSHALRLLKQMFIVFPTLPFLKSLSSPNLPFFAISILSCPSLFRISIFPYPPFWNPYSSPSFPIFPVLESSCLPRRAPEVVLRRRTSELPSSHLQGPLVLQNTQGYTRIWH